MSPPSFDPLTVVSTRLGSITFAESESPAILLVTPRGYVGPTLVRRDLEVAREYARKQATPWWYVVDPTDAVPNPANIVFLRAVRKLPGVAGYFVVARRQPMRAISIVLRRLGGPHRVFASLDAAIASIEPAP